MEPKNGSSMASLEEPFEAPLFLRVYALYSTYSKVTLHHTVALCEEQSEIEVIIHSYGAYIFNII